MKLNKNQSNQLRAASGIGKRVKFVYPDSGSILQFRIVDEVSNIVGPYKNILQQLELVDDEWEDGSKYSYRFAYYVFSFRSRRVVWAQRPLLVSSKDCQDLLSKARARGWDIG